MLLKTYYLKGSVTLERRVGTLSRDQFVYQQPCNLVARLFDNTCMFLVLHPRISPLNCSCQEDVAEQLFPLNSPLEEVDCSIYHNNLGKIRNPSKSP